MKRKAFSLIELLIVVMIIGVIYTLSVGSLNKMAQEKEKLTLENLKTYLFNIPHKKYVQLLCLDDCSSCDIYADNSKIQTVDNFLDKSVRAYRYDYFYGYTEIEKEVYLNTDNVEKDICFSYVIDKSGVGSQVLVEFQEKFYEYTSYFDMVHVYNSIEDAREAKESLIQEVKK